MADVRHHHRGVRPARVIGSVRHNTSPQTPIGGRVQSDRSTGERNDLFRTALRMTEERGQAEDVMVQREICGKRPAKVTLPGTRPKRMPYRMRLSPGRARMDLLARHRKLT